MPNIKSAIKRVKVSSVKSMQNRMSRSALRTAIKRFETAVAAGDRETVSALHKKAIKSVDKSCAKGIIHKNTAARRKSSMALKVNKMASV